MSLSALLNSEPSGHRTDKVLMAYDRMEESEASAFRVLIKDPNYSAPQIAKAMGGDITPNKVRHFRMKLRTGQVNL